MTTKGAAAIVVAAGRGERAGGLSDGPKQYRLLGGTPILARTLGGFLAHPHINRVVAVIHEDDRALFESLSGLALDRVEIIIGGPTRQASVRNGLAVLESDPPEIVLIHDGVRPFVTPELIDAVIRAVDADTAALPAIPVADTLKQMDAGFVGETVPRAGLAAAQTPQGFPFARILEAHRAAAILADEFTDDAAIAEWAGLPVRLVQGSVANVKLTTAEDITAANERLRKPANMIDVRVGNGYDVHRLVPGDYVTLCGVRIAHDKALSGHSDADVGLHALTDALLATIGDGDIGTHFPPSDPQWKGASSDCFLRYAASAVQARGGRIANVDITLICEAPKVAPHRDRMRETLAGLLDLEIERTSVKATTNETIGFIGREEGIAAIATASVIFGASS